MNTFKKLVLTVALGASTLLGASTAKAQYIYQYQYQYRPYICVPRVPTYEYRWYNDGFNYRYQYRWNW